MFAVGKKLGLFFALMAVSAVMWQSFAGPLEHLGLIPHAHPAGAYSMSGSSDGGEGHEHHHHLSDMQMEVPAVYGLVVLGLSQAAVPSLPALPEPPAAGIEYPPRRG